MVAGHDTLAYREQAGVRHELNPDSGEHDCGTTSSAARSLSDKNVARTGSPELCVETLSEDSLHAEGRAHERETDEGTEVCPGGVVAFVSNAALA